MNTEYIEENNLPDNIQIIEQIVFPKIKRAFCKKCKQELTRSSEVLLTSPLKYQYKCGCGAYYTSFHRYPELIYQYASSLNSGEGKDDFVEVEHDS